MSGSLKPSNVAWMLIPRASFSQLLLVWLQAELWLLHGALGSWVVGGYRAAPHSRPFMASIQLNGQHFCGGFLVQRRWVMTAAHCVIPRRSPSFRVVLGAHILRTPEAFQQAFGIQESLAHPLYNPKTVENDIRMLKLNRSAILNRFVQRVRLPRTNTDLRPGARCQVSGWGDISNFGTLPTQLMIANTIITSRESCNTSWAGHVSGCMLCASSPLPGLRGFCSGDSGGPLVCGRRAHGIVSFNGKRCGDKRFPDVYTQISKYIPWIRYVLQMF